VIAYLSIRMGGTFLACLTCLGIFCSVQLGAQGPPSAITVSKPVMVSDPPETRSPVSLKAVNDPRTGKAAFSFDGREDPPVIRANPGEDIQLTYTNAMSTHSQEHCVDGPCMNMTNLHFHGLHVSPDFPQDDVITMMAMPGESLHYIVNIPPDQAPGLYWYHTHPHGESYQQDLDGMS
jgi:suppressor of ftsI